MCNCVSTFIPHYRDPETKQILRCRSFTARRSFKSSWEHALSYTRMTNAFTYELLNYNSVIDIFEILTITQIPYKIISEITFALYHYSSSKQESISINRGNMLNNNIFWNEWKLTCTFITNENSPFSEATYISKVKLRT